jgi:hypothetical protein
MLHLLLFISIFHIFHKGVDVSENGEMMVEKRKSLNSKFLHPSPSSYSRTKLLSLILLQGLVIPFRCQEMG